MYIQMFIEAGIVIFLVIGFLFILLREATTIIGSYRRGNPELNLLRQENIILKEELAECTLLLGRKGIYR